MSPDTSNTIQCLDWHLEQCQHVINRLRSILHSPDASDEDKRIASDMLHFYHSLIGEN